MMSFTQKIVDFSTNSQMARDKKTSSVVASLSAWKAFQSGMQVLHRYANRSPVDIHAIAKSNLKLLHRSLSYNTQYNNSIESIRYESSKSGLPVLRRVYADKELTADLLSLQDKASINMISQSQHYAMYLLVSGNAQLGDGNKNVGLTQHWWNRFGSNSDNNFLRNGAVIIASNQQTNSRLTAQGKNCLVLRVHIPSIEVACEIAS